MNQRGFVNVILIIVIVIFAGVVSHFLFIQKQSSNNRPYTTTQTNLPTKASPGGPLDTGLADVKIISVNGEIAYLEVRKIRDYHRYPKATYPELKQGDKLDVRIFHFASATSGEKRVALGQKEGDPNLSTPQTQPDIGKTYLGEMNLCIKDYIGGLSCEYEGWSAALYPL